MEVFYKLILLFSKHAQSSQNNKATGHSQNSQNNKFSMSLQYLKKRVRDEVDFWINLKVSCKLILTLWPLRFPRK